MTVRELLRFKERLASEQDTAVRAALKRRQSIAIEQSAETYERSANERERELALADLTRHSDLLRQIQAALGRIDSGTFGVCQLCGKPIRQKRLMAVPWTPLCIHCRETADRQEETTLYSAGKARATAA